MMGLDGMRMPPSLDSWTTCSLQKVLPLSTKEGGWGFSVEAECFRKETFFENHEVS